MNDSEREINSVDFVATVRLTVGMESRLGERCNGRGRPARLMSTHHTPDTAGESAENAANITQWIGPSQSSSKPLASREVWKTGRRCNRMSWTLPAPWRIFHTRNTARRGPYQTLPSRTLRQVNVSVEDDQPPAPTSTEQQHR